MENVLSPQNRLKAIQAKLEARGVMDVKITFAPGFHLQPLTELYTEVANFLDAYLEGRSKPITVGDAPDCWACHGTGKVTTSSNGSGLIEADCENCLGDPPKTKCDHKWSLELDGYPHCLRCKVGAGELR